MKKRHNRKKRMAQYAMYAYCFFAILSLVNTVCGSLGVAVNIPSILLTIKQWVLMLATIALWGTFRLIQPRNEKLLRGDGILLCVFIRPVNMF
nr:hypothetical protein [uncultured Prevotella sp.]